MPDSKHWPPTVQAFFDRGIKIQTVKKKQKNSSFTNLNGCRWGNLAQDKSNLMPVPIKFSLSHNTMTPDIYYAKLLIVNSKYLQVRIESKPAAFLLM